MLQTLANIPKETGEFVNVALKEDRFPKTTEPQQPGIDNMCLFLQTYIDKKFEDLHKVFAERMEALERNQSEKLDLILSKLGSLNIEVDSDCIESFNKNE